jgi:hypothetical protein
MTKEVKCIYKAEMAKAWESVDMIDFCVKETAEVVTLSGGEMIGIDKQKLETRFCFGAGMYAHCTDEEMNAAESAADVAKNDIDYFFRENVKKFDDKLDVLKKALSGDKAVYIYHEYTGREDCRIFTYTCVNLCDSPEYEPFRWERLQGVRKLAADDIQLLIDGILAARVEHVKKINKYLKRFGLSKVESWTYVRD